MHDVNLLKDLVVVIVVSLGTIYALRPLRIPNVVGFLVAGMLIGPGGLSLVSDRPAIEVMAEIGVVLLLFTIGLRFSLRELSSMKAMVVGLGGLQMLLTSVVGGGLALAFGMSWQVAVLLGALMAMSSTAIVLRLIDEQGGGTAPHGRIAVSILLFQDLAVIPVMVLIPLLAAGATASPWEAMGAVGYASAAVAIILLGAKYIFPWLLERFVRTRSGEIFTLTTIALVLGTAMLAKELGLSLALGAFLAGIVVSESEYAQQMLAEISPFRDAFNSLFFVSVGMLVDPVLWLREPGTLLGMTAAVLGLKAILIWLIVFAFGFGSRVATLAGMALAQVGEFSFILAQEGAAVGLLDGVMHARVIAVSVLTMLLTPFAIIASPRLARRAPRLAWLEAVLARRGGSLMSVRPALAEREEHVQRRVERLKDHVIIVGFGINGVNVARVLRQLSVPYVVLEINPEAVRVHREAGELVRFGDATRDAILQSVGVDRARAVVLAIADPASSRTIVRKARRMNGDLFIIVRTRFVTEVDELYVLGADEVVPEEFETSLELAGRIMTNFGVAERLINREKAIIRQERYRLLRGERRRSAVLPTLETMLAATDFAEVPLDASAPAVGRNLRELDLRHRTGASVIGVCRHEQPISNPSRDFTLMADDLVLLFGNADQLEAAEQALTGQGPDERSHETQPVDASLPDGARGRSK